MQKDEHSVTIPLHEYEKLQSDIIFLKQQLSDLQRLIFGKKSERFVPVDNTQLNLFEGVSEASIATESEEITYERKKTKKDTSQPVRALLPAHLPRKEEVIEPENLPADAKKIGEEVTEILEYNPATIYVRRIVRPKYVSKTVEGVKIAPLPSLPIAKGNAGASLLAYLQVSKWVDHLPYYRQVQIYKRIGVELSESTVNGWFTATCELLTPLYDLLVKNIRQQNYLQADESPIPVQDKEKNATHTGYHWVYHAPLAKMVVFDYQKTRSQEGPAKFLKDFKGTLQTDGYAGYNGFSSHPNITLTACMAHARRYFEKALDNDAQKAGHALELIKKLYVIEREAREHSYTTEQLLQERQEKAIPLLNEFKAWLDKMHALTTPKSRIGVAINYTLGLWSRLCQYASKGELLIDNNKIENCIRPLALGRKNYLFAGSHNAAQRAAMMYSFFATCKLNNIDPYKWLCHTLEIIPDTKLSNLATLLPQNFVQ